jgi:hypothetical protein
MLSFYQLFYYNLIIIVNRTKQLLNNRVLLSSATAFPQSAAVLSFSLQHCSVFASSAAAAAATARSC